MKNQKGISLVKVVIIVAIIIVGIIFVVKMSEPQDGNGSVQEEQEKYNKTLQEKELLNLVESLADNVVNSLASNSAMTGHDKFKTATSLVGGTLAEKGFDVDQTMVEHAVQSAYEKSDLTPATPKNQINTGVIDNTNASEIPAGEIKTGVINND